MIEFKQTPNYSVGTIKKIGWVFHGTLGSYKGAVEWLMTPANKRPDGTSSSAHYVIGRKEGEVIQLVKESDVAWHAGNISNPSLRARNVLPKNGTSFANPNQYFCGIEFAWGYDTDFDGDIDNADRTLTEWQYKCAAEILKNSGFYKPETLLSHKEIADYKGDDMLFAVNEINRRLAAPVVTPPQANPNAAIVARLKEINAEEKELLAKLSL